MYYVQIEQTYRQRERRSKLGLLLETEQTDSPPPPNTVEPSVENGDTFNIPYTKLL